MTPEEKKLQTENITESVAKAVLPVMDEKIATLKEEIEESTKNLATKEDVVAALGSKMVNKSEKLAEAKGNFTKMLKALKDNDVESIKAMNTTTSSEGGYLVHPEFEKGVYKIMNDYGIYKDCKLSPMSSNTKYITKRLTGVDVFYVDQASTYTDDEMTWDRVELIAKKVGAILPTTYELIEDNATDEDIWAQAQVELAEAFALFIDKEVLVGTNSGASKILGITKLTGVNVTTLTGNISTITSDKLIDCSRSVKQKFKKVNKPKWYMNESAIAVVEKLKDTAGQPLFRTLNDGEKMYLLGYEISLTDVMPASPGLNTPCIAFGSLKHFVLGIKRGMELEMGYRTGDWEKDIKSLKARMRFTGLSLDDAAFGIIKTAAS